MPEEEEQCKCPNCSEAVEADEVMHSTSTHGDVCSDCYDEVWCCDNCSDEYIGYNQSTTDIHGDAVCQSCIDDEYHICESSDEYFNFNREEYYSYGGTIVHSDYASDYEADSCCNCGCSIYMNEVYADYWEDSQQCYDCHNKRERHINEDAFTSNNKVNLDKHYRKFGSEQSSPSIEKSIYSFKKQFYGDYQSYESSNLYLMKSHIGYGSDYGFWRSEMEVTSEHYKKFAHHLRDMISHNLFIVEHKKYGLYHPLRDVFSSCIQYYDKKESSVRAGKDLSMEQLGHEWLRFNLDFVDVRKMTHQLRHNKTNEGADLRKLLNNIFNRSYKNRIPGYYDDNSTYWPLLQQYQTNSSGIKLPVRVGFDASLMKEWSRFNETVGSCQVSHNNESYAFGMMDMLTNPHLLLLVYDEHDDHIIGRSVVKFYKDDWKDKSAPIYITPSRLYLSEQTQAKKDIYVSVFKCLHQFGVETFGEAGIDFHIAVHKYSRHDSSIKSYVADSSNFTFKPIEKELATAWWLPYWLEKPHTDEAEYCYYQDESASMHFIRNSSLKHSTYAAQERIRAHNIEIIEVKQKENEQ